MALLPVLLDMVDEIYSNLDNPEKTFGDIPLLFVPHGRRGDRECPRRKEHHGHGEGHGHRHHGPGGHKHDGHGHKHKGGHSSDEEKQDQGRCRRKEGHSSDEEERGQGRCRRKERFARFAELRKGHCPYPAFGRCQRFGGRCGPCKKTTSDDFKVAFDVKSFNPEEISVKVKGREILVDGKHDERADEHGFVSRHFTRRYIVPDEYDIETVATYLDSDGKMTITASKPKPVIDTSNERVIPIERVASVQEEIGEALAAVDLMDDDTSDSKKDA